MRNYLFTSESVSEGHPDKLCDQISDAVLDACLRDDADSRVACETYATSSLILVGGEITTKTYVDIQDIAKNVVKDIGYDDPNYGLDYKSMTILNAIHTQSPDIDQGVSGNGLEQFKGQQGAGDQGMMFGFACNETSELMPAAISIAHKLLKRASAIRNSGEVNWLKPDAKSQVTIEYENDKPKRVNTVVMSHQHHESVKHRDIEDFLISKVIRPVLEESGLPFNDNYFINPTGKFVVGGPTGDTGLTGRKIIVDTYGGMGRHGGGAFSGKDPSKVDRSAAYMARYIAKNIVAAGLTSKCEIQLSYAIGVPHPVSIYVDTFGDLSSEGEIKISNAISKVFDLTPAGIIKHLDLKKPIYLPTATYGHFGKENFSWEKTDKVEELLKNY